MQKRFIGFVLILILLALPLTGCVQAPDSSGGGGGGGNSANPEAKGSDPTTGVPPGPSPAAIDAPAQKDAPRYSGPIQFSDVTAQAGIHFKHNSGAYGKHYMPETVGAGCAFLDYDNDGWQDILLVNSANWPDHKGAKSYPALYHNNKNGTFTDVTKDAGLALDMYGLGCAVADFDNDGNPDIYITCLNGNHLFHNLGNGKFADVTAKAGVANNGFSTSAVWFDYDKDGKLDLFVCNYVEWSIDKDITCMLDGKHKSYCTPEAYKGQSATLYHNNGNGTFTDVTKAAGMYDPAAKSLGAALLDYDNDGWMDLFVANDTQPNKLYHNNGNGTFTDEGIAAGVAFNEEGKPRAGMGTDAADYDGSGSPSLLVGNFSNEMIALYHNEGKGLFADEAPKTAIGQASMLTLSFACFFFDYDLDGLPDVFAANGHVADDISNVQPKIQYAEPPHLFRNLGKGKFESVADKVGHAFQQAMVARGAAYGDFDNDGDLDLLITSNNGPARLLRNDGGNQNNLLRIKTVGTASNRDGIGAKVTLTLANQQKLWSLVKTGSSYCSQSELPVTFGLGKADKVASVVVSWPSGRVDTLTDVAANQMIIVQESKGQIAAQPISFGAPTP